MGTSLFLSKSDLMEMKFTKLLSYIVMAGMTFSFQSAFSQLVTNNGASAYIKPGCLVVVKNSSVNNATGLIDNAGDFYIDQNITNAGTMTGGGANGNYFVGGDWINNGTFTADQSKVELTGAAQQISGSNPTTFYNLTLLGTGVKSQTVNASTSNILSLGTQELNTNGNIHSVTNPATTAIQFTTGFVSSTGNGRLSRATNTTAPYFYPVGSNVGTPRYRPIEITPSSATNEVFAVRMANVDASSEGYNRSLRDSRVCDINPLFYHLIDQTQGTNPADLTFFYQPTNDGSYSSNAHWQNVPQWEDMGNVTNGTSGAFTTQTALGWSDFSFPAFALSKPAPIVNIGGLNASYCGNAASVTLTGSPVGGIFSGQGVSGNIFNPSSLSAGNYTVSYTYTDPITQCSKTATANTTVNAVPAILVTPSGPTSFCAGQSVDLAASGAQTYAWSNGSSGSNLNVTSSGNYTVTGTDANGCSSASSATNVNVLSAPVPTITSSGTNTICTGTTVTLTSTPAQSYAWSDGSSTPSISVTAAGTYDVDVTYANGCTASNSFVLGVGVPPVPQITADGPLSFCAGENVIFSADQIYPAYSWNNYNSTANFINVINSGTYSVTVTDVNGCTGTSNALTVTVFALPNPYITPTGLVEICAGDNVTVSTQAGFNAYAWSPSGGTTETASFTQSGYYYVTVTDANGCTNYSDSLQVVVNSLPSIITITANGPTNFCEGNSVILSAPSGYQSYSWNEGSETQNVFVDSAGTYYCVVTDQNGCSPSSVSNTIVVNVFSGTPAVASFSGNTLSSSPAISYQWYLNGQILLGATGQTYEATSSGVYYVITTDANGCVNKSNTLEFTFTGFEEMGLQYINIYPNPSENQVMVDIKFNAPTDYKIEFTDMVGKQVLMPDTFQNKDELKKAYNLSELATGVYFVKLTAKGETLVQKLLKN
jgi:hypothetical protein